MAKKSVQQEIDGMGGGYSFGAKVALGCGSLFGVGLLVAGLASTLAPDSSTPMDSTGEEEEAATTSAEATDREVLGRWASSHPTIDGYVYYEEDMVRYVDTKMSDGSTLTEMVEVKERGGRKVLRPTEGGEEHFVIHSDGTIGSYDSKGLIRKGEPTE